ncbi:MAG: CDP-alcohol phosphatidyltransferase family protein [Candidatus Aenigmarchaeota archaeon]|nr:CDP-alcohol phosphatidyltransferase family protein [Candidatus Aenigmarchaeota archaeon]
MLSDFSKKYPRLRKLVTSRFLFKINPNYITFLAFLMACFAGYFFYISSFILASLFVLLNGFFDILDGEIARKYNINSKLGDFLDHTLDRLADIAILLGITLSSAVPDIIGFSLIIVTLLVSYLGTQAHALTKKRFYGGIIGRADRIIIIFVASVGMMLFEKSLYYGVLLLILLSFVTFLQRFYIIYKQLK